MPYNNHGRRRSVRVPWLDQGASLAFLLLNDAITQLFIPLSIFWWFVGSRRQQGALKYQTHSVEAQLFREHLKTSSDVRGRIMFFSSSQI